MPYHGTPSGFAVLPVCAQECMASGLWTLIFATSPSQPPTSLSAMYASGASPKTIMKNWSTSL